MLLGGVGGTATVDAKPLTKLFVPKVLIDM